MGLQEELTGSEIDKSGVKAILVPTDFSENSDAALKVALDIAGQQHARIYLLHTAQSEQIAVEREMMHTQIGKFSGTSSVEIIPDIRKGVSYKEILKAQAEKGIDLIVLASRGKTDLPHILAGSVTRKIVKAAKCSVLVVGE
jgi:nucleotide-binding universal stress UspA family protein